MKHFLKFLSVTACLLSLSACETVEGFKQDIQNIDLSGFTTANSVSSTETQSEFLIDGDCPQINLVNELDTLNEFAPENDMDAANLVSHVTMSEENSTCTYNERSVTVDLKLAFDGKLGPKGRSSASETPFFSYPFFVAVTTQSGKILAKEIFAASMTYEEGQNNKIYFETLRQIIPADSRLLGSRYKVMIGFQLAEKQLAYNRKVMEEERIATEQREAERIAAEKVAKQTAEKAAKTTANTATNETDATTTSPQNITAPAEIEQEQIHAGPFDIFKQ